MPPLSSSEASPLQCTSVWAKRRRKKICINQNIVSFHKLPATFHRGGCFSLAERLWQRVPVWPFILFHRHFPPSSPRSTPCQGTGRGTIHERAHTFPARAKEKLHVACPNLNMCVCVCECVCVYCMHGGCYWLVFDFIDFHKAAFMANFVSTPIRGAAVEIKVLSICIGIATCPSPSSPAHCGMYQLQPNYGFKGKYNYIL